LETSSTKPVTCTSSSTTGEITGAKTIGDLQVTFSGCYSTEGGGCSVKGAGAGGGKIVTSTLSGELGSVKFAEAGSGVGLLISPTTGTTFATLEGTCLIASPAPIDGSIAAEVSPTEEKETVDELNLVGSTGKQEIKEINVLGTVKKPSLTSLGLLESSEATGEELLFGKSVKVVGAAAADIEVVKPEGGKQLELLINGGTKGVIEYKNTSAVLPWFPARSNFVTQNNGFVEVAGTNRCVGGVVAANGGTCKVEVEFTLGTEGVENIFLMRAGAPDVDLKSIK
jgi:hypothetical protein